MLRRRFGRTELQLPVFSCGGMRYQHKWQDQPLSEIPREGQANLEETIWRAFELGINHIETARGYGTSERQLGCVIPRLPREELILQTKVEPTEDPRKFEQHFEESLERLRVDYVDLLAIHGINNEETLQWSLRRGGCLDVALRFKAEGRARHIGFSSHGDLQTLLGAIHAGGAEPGAGFDYVNLHWYFIFQRNWPAIEAARARDMGVFIISPSDKGGMLFRPPDILRELCAPLSPMVFNDLFCLSHSQVHTLSLGAAQPSDFDEHLKVLPLLAEPQALLRPIQERLAQAMERAVGHGDPEAVLAGLPRWQDTPGQYNLPIILWLRNLVKGWGMEEYACRRYNLLQNGGHWFAGERPENVEHIPAEELKRALVDHPDAARIPGWLAESVDLLQGESQKRLSKQEG